MSVLPSRARRKIFERRLRRALLPLRRAVWPSVARERPQWSIGILVGESALHLVRPPSIANPVLVASDVADVEALSVADPFLHRKGDHWTLFFEVVNRRSGKGEIGCAESEDGFRWRYRRIVLCESFHLSYPYVFDFAGETFMIPESHEAGAVRLYRAARFPDEWSCVATLLEGPYLADASVYRRDGLWWLFVETNADLRHDRLDIHFAESLAGPWRPHPLNPVVRADARLARPARRIVEADGRLLRFAQDCAVTYGRAVNALEILELDPARYAERPAISAAILGPSGGGRNALAMHHLDLQRRGEGDWLAAVDGYGSP